jgi:hypothetical protein
MSAMTTQQIVALLKQSETWIAFISNTSSSSTNRVNAARLVTELQEAIADLTKETVV